MTALKKRSPPGRRGAIDAVLLASYSNYTYESNVRRWCSIEHAYADNVRVALYCMMVKVRADFAQFDK